MNRGQARILRCLTPVYVLPVPVVLRDQPACISTAASFGRATAIAMLAIESLAPAHDAIAAPVHGRSAGS